MDFTAALHPNRIFNKGDFMITLDKLKKDLFSYVDAEEDSDKKEYFYTSANKALDYIHANFPERYTAKYVIEGAQLENLITPVGSDVITVNSQPLIFESNDAKSYFFELSGVGSFSITTAGEQTVTDFDCDEFTAFRGFLDGQSRVEFFGDYRFYLRGLAFYAELLSDRVEDIPEYSASLEYDFNELTKIVGEDGEVYYPFCAFMETKFEEIGNNGEWRALADYEIVPNKQGYLLRLRNTDSQKIIYYKRHFIEVNEKSTEIDIAADLYYAFLEQFYAEYLIDENEVSVDRAGYNYRTKVALKQVGKSAENPIQLFVNERF